jgi:hypothetical protein
MARLQPALTALLRRDAGALRAALARDPDVVHLKLRGNTLLELPTTLPTIQDGQYDSDALG